MFPTQSLYGTFLLFSAVGFAQTANTVFGAGYSLPIPISAAPGQILNLFVQGVGANLTQKVAATTLPLPTVLAGISVQLAQTFAPQSVPAPLLAVRPVSTCINGPVQSGGTCARYTAVTVQIPYELVPNCQAGLQLCPSAAPGPPNAAQLIVSEDGTPGGAIDLNPIADHVHVGNLCDIDISSSPSCAAAPLITHTDGSLISAANPAKPGEEVVMYALGLGATKPVVPTGQATPSPAPVAQTVGEVWPDFHPNEGPSKGVPLMFSVCTTTVICPFTPMFAGLTPGSVGLYQVNFVIPSAPQPTFACGNGISSNLTLTIVGATSFDGAGICVATPPSGVATTSSTAAPPASTSSGLTIPLGSFVPNTIGFPIGANLGGLGQQLPSASVGVPGPSSAKP